jgi:transposase
LPTNTGRRRLNINGAIDITTMAAEVRMDDTINGESTLALIKQIEAKHPHCPYIPIICDNASYYRSKAVQEYLETSRVELIFLPPYSPNLNLIERL